MDGRGGGCGSDGQGVGGGSFNGMSLKLRLSSYGAERLKSVVVFIYLFIFVFVSSFEIMFFYITDLSGIVSCPLTFLFLCTILEQWKVYILRHLFLFPPLSLQKSCVF